MNSTWHRLALVSLASFSLPVLAADPPEPGKDPPAERIVLVGDSITDGHTYPQLVRQAFSEAGRRPPVCINAAVAGDTAAAMRARLERDVLPHRPTLVTLSAGVNDALRKVDPDAYEKDIAAIVERLWAEKIPLVLLTASILGPRHADAEKRLVEYNRRLHGLAQKNNLRVGEVFDRMKEARAAGKEVLETDQVHPNFQGQRLLARAVLDALGHKDVSVPAQLKLKRLSGILRQWEMQPSPDGKPLTAEAVASLKPDQTWKKLTLPQPTPAATWWLDHERRRGFAVGLDKAVGPGRLYQGVAEITAERPRVVYFNTGAQLEAVWLNGKRIFKSEGWTGWHAGKERVRAELQAGGNVVVIENGGDFFLSVTDDNAW
jgi:lysophospholipase L1-like esterase